MIEKKPLLVLALTVALVLFLNVLVFHLNPKTSERAVVIVSVLALNCVVTGFCGWLSGRFQLAPAGAMGLILLLLSWWGIWGRIWLPRGWRRLPFSQVLEHEQIEFIILYSLVNAVCFFFCFTVGEEQVLERRET